MICGGENLEGIYGGKRKNGGAYLIAQPEGLELSVRTPGYSLFAVAAEIMENSSLSPLTLGSETLNILTK